MIAFIKNHKTITILLTILVVLMIVNKFITQEKTQNTKSQNLTQPTEKPPSFKDVVPGKSTKEEVIAKLGNPVKEETGKNLLEFKSTAPGKPHQILLEGDKVSLIKETVTLEDKKTVNDIKKVYGEPKYVLYGPRYIAGFHLFVYPEKGIAYIGQEQSGVLLEVWYFYPTTLEEFIKKFAPDYSKTPPPQEGIY